MSAELLEGQPIAERIKDEVKQAVAQMPRPPKLAALLATDNPGARFYARSQQKACDEVGILYELHDPSKTGTLQTADELKAYVQKLNADPSVHGVILLMPVPQSS